MTESSAVRVRFAPSPTGYLHVGGVRTALFNLLFARNKGGSFILRFEDTDLDRSREELVRPMIDTFKWLGIQWDEGPEVGGPHGPYFQSQRLGFYREQADKLLDEEKAYRCYCTVDELAEMRAEAQARGGSFRYPGRCRNLTAAEREKLEAEGRSPVIRLKTPDTGEVIVNDAIHGEVVFPTDAFDDFIIIRSDGIPTYNFAVVLDDHAMGITHILRADEHLSNTPRQILVYEAFGYEQPVFAHVPIVLAPDRAKLSKRHDGVAVDEFRQKGFLPEAILNYLVLLGWSPGDGREILSMDEMIAAFTLHRVSRTPAIYDVDKMIWMNGQYLRSLPIDRIVAEARPRLAEAGYIPAGESDGRGTPGAHLHERAGDPAWTARVIDAVRQRVRTLDELVKGSSYFFLRDLEGYDEAGVKRRFLKDGVAELLSEAAARLSSLEIYNEETIEEAYRQLCSEKGIGTGKLFHGTRLAISGITVGPGLFEIMDLLGRETCVRRLNEAVEFIEAKHAEAGAT